MKILKTMAMLVVLGTYRCGRITIDSGYINT